jgi:hypothetical protein
MKRLLVIFVAAMAASSCLRPNHIRIGPDRGKMRCTFEGVSIYPAPAGVWEPSGSVEFSQGRLFERYMAEEADIRAVLEKDDALALEVRIATTARQQPDVYRLRYAFGPAAGHVWHLSDQEAAHIGKLVPDAGGRPFIPPGDPDVGARVDMRLRASDEVLELPAWKEMIDKLKYGASIRAVQSRSGDHLDVKVVVQIPVNRNFPFKPHPLAGVITTTAPVFMHGPGLYGHDVLLSRELGHEMIIKPEIDCVPVMTY